MPKLAVVKPREKIPRKAKSNVIGIDEINMIKEVLKNERAVSRRLHKKVSEKISQCGKRKRATLSNSQCLIERNLNEKTQEKNRSNEEKSSEIKDIKAIPISNIKVNEVPNNRLDNSDLSHFMDLEERKDLLTSEHDTDPLSINGPETYDGVGWVAVKQEVPDDIEISHMTITEIPLKSDTDVERFSSLPSPSPNPLPEVPECEDSNEIKCEVVMDSKTDAVKNDDFSNSPDDSWWDDGPDIVSDDREETDNSFKVTKKITSKLKQIKKYNCDICDKKLSTRGSLRIHKRNKHKITMTFHCELCSLNFDLRKELIKHRNETHKDKNGRFTCSECGKLINDYHNYLNHMKTHVDNDEFFYKGEYWKDSVKCEQCNKVFKNEECLRVHKAMLHDNGLLNEKLKLQEKNYVCNTCGKRFAFSCLLKDHVNLHTGVKPYLCQSCGRSFSQKASLKQHARTHNSVRPFQCTVCTQGFFGNGDLKKHMRKHTGERPYVCEMCGDGFSRSSHLGVHRRSHTGERPYKCDVCSRGFTKKGDVVRHRRIHTGELPYLCQVCGKAFRQSTQCVNHIKHHHPESLVSVAKNPSPGSQWVF